MNVQKKVIVVQDQHGDWEGFYLDGLLWGEGHSLTHHAWAEVINNHWIDSVEIKTVNGSWLEESGSLPNKFEDIPKEKFV